MRITFTAMIVLCVAGFAFAIFSIFDITQREKDFRAWCGDAGGVPVLHPPRMLCLTPDAIIAPGWRGDAMTPRSGYGETIEQKENP